METELTYKTIWLMPIWLPLFSFPLALQMVINSKLQKGYYSILDKSKRLSHGHLKPYVPILETQPLPCILGREGEGGGGRKKKGSSEELPGNIMKESRFYALSTSFMCFSSSTTLAE